MAGESGLWERSVCHRAGLKSVCGLLALAAHGFGLCTRRVCLGRVPMGATVNNSYIFCGRGFRLYGKAFEVQLD